MAKRHEGVSEAESRAEGEGREGKGRLARPRLKKRPPGAPITESPTGDTDINVRGVIAFAGGLLGLLGLTAALVWGLYVHYKAVLRENDPAPRPLLEANAPEPPPGPRLQENPPLDMAAMRAREESVLRSYAWVDKDAGITRIPLERAMDLAARGVTAPKRAPASAAQRGAGGGDGKPDGGRHD